VQEAYGGLRRRASEAYGERARRIRSIRSIRRESKAHTEHKKHTEAYDFDEHKKPSYLMERDEVYTLVAQGRIH
jgi:hypothetical protein